MIEKCRKSAGDQHCLVWLKVLAFHGFLRTKAAKHVTEYNVQLNEVRSGNSGLRKLNTVWQAEFTQPYSAFYEGAEPE